jgi:hypothetical protein
MNIEQYKTAFFKATGCWGALVCDCDTGNVVSYNRSGDWEKEGDGYDTISRLDVNEWHKTYPAGELSAGHDILDFGLWDANGVYDGPEEEARAVIGKGRRKELWDEPYALPQHKEVMTIDELIAAGKRRRAP